MWIDVDTLIDLNVIFGTSYIPDAVLTSCQRLTKCTTKV